ncbi:MAG TPA: hypothetical protein ENI45_03705, partial [Thermoplasmatales archaeon]|nr:hypothetical protein [Thermoplasmatales archaeon]
MKSSVKYVYDFQKELSVLKEIEALLSWDQMTFMPPRGVRRRAEQFSLISKISHEKIISDKLWKHIENLTRPSVFDKLNDADRAVVKRLRSDVEKARKIPVDYIERLSKTTTLAYSAWERARNKDDFSIFRPYLENVVELQKEFCRYIDLPGSSYNSILDNYEEGMTVEKLEKEFSYL